MEKPNYDKAILAAGEKDFSAFQKEIAPAAESKIKNALAGFMKYLEKTQFEKE